MELLNPSHGTVHSPRVSVELTEALLIKAAGWEVVKRARAYLEQGHVLSSYWEEPLLRGVVQSGGTSFRASMVIKSAIDIENLCTCREAREWGKICAHGVAVGFHWIARQKAPAQPSARRRPAESSKPTPQARKPASLQRDSQGEPAELHLILPPNLDQALAKGRLMLVLEASWAGGRCPLNALPGGRTWQFDEKTNAVMDALESLAGGDTPAVLPMDAASFARLLPVLAGFENITIGKQREAKVSRSPMAIPLKATLESDGQITVSLRSRPAAFTAIGDWAWNGEAFHRLELPAGLQSVLQSPVRISRQQVPSFLSQSWPQLADTDTVESNFKLEDFELAPQSPKFHLSLRGGLAQLQALLQCAYGSRIMSLGVTSTDEGVWLPDPDVPTRYATRDVASERSALARLQRCGFSGPDAQGKLVLAGQNDVLNFLAAEFPRLQRAWNVTLDEQLENRTMKGIERVEPRFQITPSGVQWFDLGVVFESTGGQEFSASDIQRLLLSGQKHTRLSNGKMAVIDTVAVEELQEVLLDCAPRQHENGYRIHSQQAGFVEATLRGQHGWKVTAPAAWKDRAARQTGEAKLECPPLGPLENVLRPYQKHGVAWLGFLRENGFGGILADEMGLGKTLQALAFLNSLRGTQQERRPHLVVCPTSLVFNWLAEAAKFVPDLRVLALHGPDRHQHFAAVHAHDLVVTSYALIRRDAEHYRDVEFDTVILDEAQHIKNRESQNAQSVKSVKCRHRLVLTGTPMENSVLDLWSIFDFLMPGYLGAAKDFRERYELPIVKEKNSEAQARLSRRLRPFILRRLKREVASDLPDKLEQVAYCELTRDQRAVYQQIIEASRKEVLEAEGEQGIARSRMVVLTALLRLRQICCDLRLLDSAESGDGESEQTSTPSSGKMEMFTELLEEVIDGGHRVLVFSQFVGMLSLLRAHLESQSIPYCYLDGSTPDRAAVVQRFQSDSSIPVFLISLKAGGVGLNLTGADTVIHFDPWWNPAVEAQATDRAHRIGQTRLVTSYKLITRDTVEEKILTLQNRKREIVQGTIGDEASLTASLSWDEIQELLS